MKFEELCEEMNEVPNYHDKGRQLEKFRKKVEILEPTKNNYIIVRKYSEVEQIERNKSMRKNRTYIEPLLYTYLGMQESTVLVVRMSELLERLQCVNEDYYTIKFNNRIAQDVITELNRDKEVFGLSLFMQDSEPQLKQIVYDVLRDMKRRSLIAIEYLPTVCTSIRTEEGEVISPLKILNDNERHLFLRAQELALKEFGYTYLDEVKFYEFSKIKTLIAKELNCKYVCYTYKITINTQGLQQYVLEDFYGMRSSFNRYIMDKIQNDEKRYKYLDDDEKGLYIDYCISIENCKHVKEEIKGRRKLEYAKEKESY